MPKFYRQNKKKIDPRYFLNETTNRDLDEVTGMHMSIDDAVKGLESKLYDLGDGPISDEQRGIISTLFKQLDKFKCGRVKVDMSVPDIPPMVIKQLSTLSDREDLSSFFRIAAEVVKSSAYDSDADTDNDGIPDEQELAIVDKGEI